MTVEWKEALATGIKEIDDQHKELINIINQLLEACNQGKGKEEVGKVIKFLEDYVISHFKAEENIQLKYNYPDYAAHKAQHEHFIREFIKLKSQFDNHGVSSFFVVDINRAVVEWLIQHICKTDVVLGKFLKTKI